ncbi:deoxyhypusine hydroxylase [Tribolium castaneum]|uniref:Deoxyhypusine hydroxylase n=1 Tax=Tribolium castaneum TaxID=7070 RepID=D6WZ08_TRICA|nr:PREDICTED: deoxyhypusine hydroxylase [Tribolium castaneum]EFA09033.1 Deoxyhypusine hydroxylase-like Protein [Tribolium castaneum]|eukprot:XP_970680.1 PREDICTED: deoxyhypusine hydroxylase [Tribolium castaneum]
MVNFSENQIRSIGKVLGDGSRPLKERFRALFTLRNIGGPVSIACIKDSFRDGSVLLKHELAYCLGQMQDPRAVAILVQVLEDTSQEPMVRHEAAEALGAIASPESVAVLEKFKSDPVVEVAETCELALERIKWLRSPESGEVSLKSAYNSVDPAPPASTTNVAELKGVLLDEGAPLFERYRAMFSLRNVGGKRAIEALGAGLKCGSALFRHEVAFVLGQLQDKEGVPFLRDSLEDCGENEMVRHECAEALGAIATDDCISILNKFLEDEKRVVKESCEIALDMCEYENSPEFQYANTLQVA